MASLQTDGVGMRINSFGFALQDLMMEETGTGNMALSPFSIYTVLTMLCVGADGKTKQQIAKILKSEDQDLVLEKLKPLYDSLLNQSKVKFDAPNKAWVGKNLNIAETYKNTIMKYFDAEIAGADFSQPEVARTTINDWVAGKTDDKIKDLFPPGSITESAALVLANALYFKGAWEKKFDQRDTSPNDFYLAVDNTIKVDYMYTKEKFATASDDGHKVNLLELPYEGNTFSMVLALPHDTQDDNGRLESFESINSVLDSMQDKSQIFQNWMNKLAQDKKFQEVEVFVPKFEVKSGFDLKENLQKMGVTEVFSPGAADLKGMVKGDMPELYVSAAYHKSFLSVDEEGTTAAAATGLVANFRMMSKEMFINHPFLFFLVHKESNTIMFSGKVENPLQ